jgi:NAD(P)H dehydrogenase (quinone)
MTTALKKPRCAVVLCHPRPDSFCAAVAKRAEQVARDAGFEAFERDLYAMAFDPVMHARDIGDPRGGGQSRDVSQEVALLGDPRVIMLVYPIWFGSAPALLKGYIERVLGAGFAGPGSVPVPMGPSPDLLVTIATSGATSDWIEQKGIAASAGSIFGAYVAGALAIRRAEHIAIDNVIPTMSSARGVAELDAMGQALRGILTEGGERTIAEPAVRPMAVEAPDDPIPSSITAQEDG